MQDNAPGFWASRRLWRAEIGATLSLAWPMILTNLAQTAMTATDTAMMGRLGAHTLAAGVLGTSLYFAPMIFGLGLMLATSPLMAMELGRNRHSVRDVRRTVRQGFWAATIVVIPIWLILWQSEAILLAIGQEPHLADEAGDYVRTLMWSALPFYFYLILRSFISALERPRWALVIAFAAVAFNAFANWVLMFGNLGVPSLGIAGSGLATFLSSTLMFLGMAIVVVTDRKFRRYHLFGRFWRADWNRLRTLLRLGLPIAGLLTFEVTLFNAAGLLMGLLGEVSLAAHAIAIQIASLSFMVPMGLGQAATVRVGLAAGGRNTEGITRAGWTAYVMGVSFMAAMGLVMILVPRTLISGFIDVSDPANEAVVRTAVLFLAFAALFQVVDGAQSVSGGMLRGLHDTQRPMLFAAVGYWGVGMPLGVALGFGLGWGGAGIWIGLSAGLAVVAALLLVRWLRRQELGLVEFRR